MGGCIVIGPGPNYCDGCYGEARKEGRATHDVTIEGHARKYCSQCESFARNGLVHYRPSNGTEFDIFVSRCHQCRHWIDDRDDPKPGRLAPPFTTCKCGVLDRFYVSMAYGAGHVSNWFDPADIDADDCPATCKRFTHKDDPNGEFRDPPPPDCAGQMMLGESVEIVERRAEELEQVTQ
jgi:hypothetical protein